jgi:hypothetical protein
MSSSAASGGSRKITITLPQGLLRRLDEAVPPRQRSRFIAEAVAEHLELVEQLEALSESAGAWTDGQYPDMKTGADIDRWIGILRRSWGTGEETE